MKVTRKRVCDVCGHDGGVFRFRITKLEGTSQRTVSVDLCENHCENIEEAMNAAPIPHRGRKSARPVVSLDDIAAKKASKKPATKKVAGSRKK